MKKKIKKLLNKFGAVLVIASIALPSFGAIQPDRLTQKPRALIGSGVAQDSDLNFDVGLGSSNPRLRFKNSDSSLELNKGILRFGTGAAGNQVLEADKGLGATNPKVRYNDSSTKWEFSNDGSAYTALGSGSGGGSSINLLTSDDNFGFEDGTTNWTASGGSFTAITSGSQLFGDTSGRFDASALNQTLSSAAKAVSAQPGLSGTSCIAGIGYIYATGSDGDYSLQVYDGTNVLIDVPLRVTSVSSSAFAGFGCPSSGTVLVRLIANVSNPGAIDIDGLKENSGNVQLGSNILLSAVVPITEWTNCTMTIGATTTAPTKGTIVRDECRYRRLGDSMEIKYDFQQSSGGSAGSGTYLFPIPNSQLIDTAKLSVSTNPVIEVGTGKTSSAAAGQASATIRAGIFARDATNLMISRPDATPSLQDTESFVGSTNAPLSNTNIVYSFRAMVPISGWKASVETLTQVDTTAQIWNGMHEQNCSFQRTNTAYGDPAADSTCTFTEIKNVNFGSVTSYLSGSDKLPGIVINPNRTGKFYVCAHTQLFTGGSVATYDARLWDGTTTIAEVEMRATASDNKAHQQSLCGVYDFVAGASKTLSIQLKSSADNHNIQSTNNRSVIEWVLFGLEQSFPMPLLVNTVTSGSSSNERVFRAKVAVTCTSSPCTIDSQGGGSWLTDITRSTTGTYSLNIIASTFSSTPTCVVQKRDNDGTFSNQKVYIREVSSTQVIIYSTDSSAILQDIAEGFSVICMGAK